jgi:spermidine synthase
LGILIDTADIPGGGHLRLVRHDEDFEILFQDEQLMGSWAVRSEQALATLVSERLGEHAKRLLIGGLGMGFTLAAARQAFGANTSILVAELVPKVASWASGLLAPLFGDSLQDPRVSLEIRDVHDVIAEAAGHFDAILLDVDNGPDGLVHLANERLYSNWGLRAAHRALRPEGILAIWSAYPDTDFPDRLARAGFAVEEIHVDAGELDEAVLHTIWLASRIA